MSDDSKHQHGSQSADCPRTRLAQGDLAAVDMCRCGMLQLHLGALTVRMTPGALSELLATLGQAVAAQSARRYADESGVPQLMLRSRERGEA